MSVKCVASSKKTAQVKPSTTGKSLTEFRAQYDKDYVIPKKINEGIEKLGPEGWEYELPFMKLCNTGPTDFGRYRDQFAEFYVEMQGTRSGKRIWAGSKEFAQKLREMV